MPPATAPIHPPAPIAVIGLGNMGRPMAACLVRAGFAVTGFDIVEPARQRFAADGHEIANTLAAAVSGAEIVITLLPDGPAVRACVGAMRSCLRPGAIVLDMSSSDPVRTRALGAEMIAAGFGFVDAPVSGGVKRAADGSLAIMVGGESTTIDRVQPVLAAMGKSIFRTGLLGSGHAMKALNNYVSGAGLVAAIEALQIGQAFGLEPGIIVDVLNASTGRNNSTENKLKQFVISESFSSGFTLSLMAKDIGAARDLAAATGVAAPLADRCAALWEAGAKRLGSGADHTEIGCAGPANPNRSRT